MIQSVIQKYQKLESLPGMKWSPEQRLLLASLLVDRTDEELSTFRELTDLFTKKVSRFSAVYGLRYLIPAYLCQMGISALEASRLFFHTQELVEEQRLSSALPQHEAIVALLLTLQEKANPSHTLRERIARTRLAYNKWRGMHSFLTNKSLLPVLASAAGMKNDVDRLVTDAEHTYQELLRADLKKNLKTMQFAWLLTVKGVSASTAGPAYRQYKNLFREQKVRGSSASAYLLSLHGMAPHQAVTEITRDLEALNEQKSFRLLKQSQLLRVATLTYLRENQALTLQDQAVEGTGLAQAEQDLSLYFDAADAALVTSIMVSIDSAAPANSGGRN